MGARERAAIGGYMIRGLKVSALLLGLTAVQPALALEPISPWVSLGSIHSDNAEHASVNGSETTTVDAIVGARIRENGRFNAHLDASVLYREFLQGKFDSETIPSANGSLSYAFVPQHFAISAEETLGQISSRPFDALSTTDRENVNYFSVGPDVALPMGQRNRVDFSGRYGITSFQDSNVDSSRVSGEVALSRILGEYSTISVNHRYERLDYNHAELYPSSTLQATFIRYSGESSRTRLMLELGQSSIQVGNGNTGHSPHATLLLQRRVSRRTTLAFEYTHGGSDAAESLRRDMHDGFNSTNDQNVLVTANPFTRDQGYVMLLRTSTRSAIDWQATWNREKYSENSVLDRHEYGSDLLGDYRFTSLWTLACKFRYQYEKTDLSEATRTRYRGSVGMTRRLTRALQAALVFERSQSTGTSSLDHFRENSVTLMFHYSPREIAQELFDPVSDFRSYERPWRSQLEIQRQQQQQATPGMPMVYPTR